MRESKPQLFVLGGPNGAGKTTLANIVLPKFLGINDFVNADTIARGLSAFAPETVAMEAGRLMLKRLEELMIQRADFAFESTLASRTFVNYLKRAKEAGYYIRLFYVWVPSSSTSINRVAGRVLQGGHFVPDEDVRRRYERSISNMLNLYLPLADFVEIYHNGNEGFKLIAMKNDGELDIQEPELWKYITEGR